MVVVRPAVETFRADVAVEPVVAAPAAQDVPAAPAADGVRPVRDFESVAGRRAPATVPSSVAAKAAPVEMNTIAATATITRTVSPMLAPFVLAPGLSGCCIWNSRGAALHAGHNGVMAAERFGDVRVTTPGTPRAAPL